MDGGHIMLLQWVQLPLWVMQLHLSTTAAVVYAMLANRHKLSMTTNARTGEWSDDMGIYCVYPRADLATATGLSMTTITRAMRELVAAGLIVDRRLGQGRPNRIYIPDPPAELPVADQADQLSLLSDDPDPADLTDLQEDTQQSAAADSAHPADLQEDTQQSAAAVLEDTRTEEPANQEPKNLRLPYIKKKIASDYLDRSDKQAPDKAIIHCLRTAYNIQPDQITPDHIQTALDRCSRAHNVRNPITYAAKIISNLISAEAAESELTDFDLEWLAEVSAFCEASA